MQFTYEAMRGDGSTTIDLVEAGDRAAAAETLRGRGLLVLRVEPRPVRQPRAWLPVRPAARPKTGPRDLILLSRQLKMLLESGAPLVNALEAVEQQTSRPGLRSVVRRLRDRVQEGDSLCAAMEGERATFDSVFRSMVAAGEATAALPTAFARLSELAQQQQRTRKLVIGALLYPAVLTVMLAGVLSVLLFFVVPRFRLLFTTLNAPLPATTRVLFTLSQSARLNWPYLLAGALGLLAGLVLLVRLPASRRSLDCLLLRCPLVGRLTARLIFARVIRIWAAMLRCHVPLLEAIRHSRAAVTNKMFLRLIDEIEETVSSGGRVGQALATARVAEPVIVSALRTGEDNGRLAEAADFVSTWLDEDNASAVQHLTRLAEPLLLALMGVVVGLVAMSLFLPLFDLATAAH